MIKLRFCIFHLAAAALACSGQDAAVAPVDQQIAAIEAGMAAALQQRVDIAFAARAQDLDLKYSLALGRALDTASREGKLDEALALREEKKRFDERATVPEADGPSDPASITQLRSTYRAEVRKIEAERELAAAPVHAEFDAKLEAYQTQLTKLGRLDDALKVKAAREKISKTPAAVAATPTPDAEGWQVVFDGSSIDLWKPAVSSRNFRVADGVLFVQRNTDEPDLLYFKGSPTLPEKLKNFELRARIKSDAEANSGFYFHLHGKGVRSGGHPASGVEVSLHNGAKPAKFPTGSLYDLTEMKPAAIDQSEWFDLHFKVVDRIVTVLLNDKPYLEHLVALSPGEDQKGIQPEGGLLAIQANSRDGGYYFEKIEIKPLP